MKRALQNEKKNVSMILDKLYIDGRPCQEEIEGGVGVLRNRSRGTRSGEDAVQVDGENSNSEDKAVDQGVFTRGVR